MAKKRLWPIFITLLLALLCIAYAFLPLLQRALVAVSTYRAHVFAPPPRIEGESRLVRLRDDAEFYWDFSKLHTVREQQLKLLNPALEPLVKEMSQRQAAGKDVKHSMNIYREIRWRLNFTSNTATARQRIDDLRRSLAETEAQQALAGQQQESDGSWGLGIDVWYLRLYYSVEKILSCTAPPRYPLRYLDRINSPRALHAQLEADLFNDFTKTGIFNREELDETVSAINRMLFRNANTGCYAFHPELKDSQLQFIARWQNPSTGFWGQWMVDRHGRIWKMDDMAMTFHVVSDLNGKVSHLDQIATRTLQLDHVNFPAGIRFNGHYENHLNWDAVKILRKAWPVLEESTRQQARTEISAMLAWSLKNSYQPDGSFKVSDLDDTPGDAYQYGIYFLAETGFFQREKRFWTDQDFPQSAAIRDRIEARLRSTGLDDPRLKEAYETLEATKTP
jgi:hypothetical protein